MAARGRVIRDCPGTALQAAALEDDATVEALISAQQLDREITILWRMDEIIIR